MIDFEIFCNIISFSTNFESKQVIIGFSSTDRDIRPEVMCGGRSVESVSDRRLIRLLCRLVVVIQMNPASPIRWSSEPLPIGYVKTYF